MEVSSREDLSLFGKNKGIVGHRIGFDAELLCGKAHLVQAGSQNLGLAAQGVGILNMTAVFMGGIDFTLV